MSPVPPPVIDRLSREHAESHVTPGLDEGSFIHGYINRRNTARIYSGQIMKILDNAGPIVGLDGVNRENGSLLNITDGTTKRAERFVVPWAGTGTFSVRARLPTGVASGTFNTYVYRSAGNEQIAARACVMREGESTFDLEAEIAADEECYWAIEALTARILAARPRFTMRGGRGSLYGKRWARRAIALSDLHGNACFDPQDRYDFTSPLSFYQFWTNERFLALEYFATSETPGFSDIGIFCDDGQSRAPVPFQFLTPANTTQINITPVIVLPYGWKRVTIRMPPQADNTGAFLRAVYIGANAIMHVVAPAGAVPKCVFGGDSLLSGAVENDEVGSSVAIGVGPQVEARSPYCIAYQTMGGASLSVAGSLNIGWVALTSTLDVANDGLDLPRTSIPFTATSGTHAVAAGFAATGTAYVPTDDGLQRVTYTGITTDTIDVSGTPTLVVTGLTGCAGGTGTMSAGEWTGVISSASTPVFLRRVYLDQLAAHHADTFWFGYGLNDMPSREAGEYKIAQLAFLTDVRTRFPSQRIVLQTPTRRTAFEGLGGRAPAYRVACDEIGAEHPELRLEVEDGLGMTPLAAMGGDGAHLSRVGQGIYASNIAAVLFLG